MSSRQDTYKSLCLIEAQKSPLHYRHGCVIVRGGKVIGSGHNHYRPGFNGGALSTGGTGAASSVSPSHHSKKKKQKTKFKQSNLSGNPSGGYMAKIPLSMHSEMMAIRAALSLSAHHSGGSARGMAWLVKGSFKPSGDTKRKDRLRKYVDAVCNEAEGRCFRYGTLAQDEVWGFEPNTCRFKYIQQQGLQQIQSVSEERERLEEEKEVWRRESSRKSSRVSISVPVCT